MLNMIASLERLPILSSDEDGAAAIAAAPSASLREIVRRFWPYARPYRRWLLPTLLLVALGPAIDTVTIGLYERLVDQVLGHHRVRVLHLGVGVGGSVVELDGDEAVPELVAQELEALLRHEPVAPEAQAEHLQPVLVAALLHPLEIRA